MTTSTSAPYQYQSTFGGTPNLAHIRVLNGKGEEIHYEPNARGSTIKLDLERENGNALDQITLRGGIPTAGGTVLEITSTMRLNEHPGNKPLGYRKHKCSHPGHGAGERFRVKTIQILNAPRPFRKDARALSTHPTYFSEEFRLMIWLDR
jgi:hypothetical protein